MLRREFIVLLAVVALDLDARAETRRRVGLLLPGSPSDSDHYARGFVAGLRETGYIEGENVVIDYRWGEGQYERLPALARDLVQSGAAVIAAGGPPATLAATAATSTVPIVAALGDYPALLRLVGNLNRPEGNVTGIAPFVTADIWGKRLELLRDMVPKFSLVAILTNPGDDGNPKPDELSRLAAALRIKLLPLSVRSDEEMDAAFAAASRQAADGLVVSAFPFFTVRRGRIVALAARASLPAIYPWPDYVSAGGLMSYGSNLVEAWRQVGLYAGKILNGAKPSELPVQQPTRLELHINLKTANALRLAVPPALVARADEVIE
jgi:putative ABC transport system substrate-binding protein